MEKSSVKRPRGRPKGATVQPYNVTLEPEMAEWGQLQPGGLSLLLRRLLREAYAKANSDDDSVPLGIVRHPDPVPVGGIRDYLQTHGLMPPEPVLGFWSRISKESEDRGEDVATVAMQELKDRTELLRRLVDVAQIEVETEMALHRIASVRDTIMKAQDELSGQAPAVIAGEILRRVGTGGESAVEMGLGINSSPEPVNRKIKSSKESASAEPHQKKSPPRIKATMSRAQEARRAKNLGVLPMPTSETSASSFDGHDTVKLD